MVRCGGLSTENSPCTDFLETKIETIGRSAFSESKLDGILIFPSTLESINDYALQNTFVSTIYLNGTNEISLGNIFRSASNCLIYTQSKATFTHANIPNVIARYDNNYCVSLRLVDNSPFRCPEAFTAGKVTFTKQFNQLYPSYSGATAEKGKASLWYGLSLPFLVTKITASDGRIFAPFNSGVEGAKPFWLRRMTAGNTFENVTNIEAGEPYIIAFPNNESYDAEYNVWGNITFTTEEAVTIPVTEEYGVNGGSYSMRRNYEVLPKSSSIYLLNSPHYGTPSGVQGSSSYAWGSVFIRSLRDSWPFEAYISSPWSTTSAFFIDPSANTRSARPLGRVPCIDDM